MGKSALLTMGSHTQVILPLLPGLTGQDLFFSFGKEVPDLSEYDDVSYWFAGAYAARLQNIGLALNLCSPGPNWLTSLPVDLTGRLIVAGTIDSLPSEGEIWVKPSEAKVNSFPAGLNTKDELEKVYIEEKLDRTLNLQWTTEILDIQYEHRFFVTGSNVITGSPYGRYVDYGHDGSWTRYDEAKFFAEHVLTQLGPNQPPAFTLDVGFNVNSQNWLVVEANRAWSSGFYGSDPTLALEVVSVSTSYTGSEWKWVPDKHLVGLEHDWTTLKIVDKNFESSMFHKFLN